MGTTAHLWTVALLFLLTTNTGLSQRSGKTITHRNLPVGADVKKDSRFECPEEFGYYPHPNDCSQYYVCVFGGALLESCTGGLMYSHELQTCDWPRNVGCDIPAAVEQERPREQPIRQQQQVQELATRSRFSVVSHQPSPSPSPTHPPPPLPSSRVQPNPVITIRGQPRPLEHEEIAKQQLYAEVEELPPAEEIENDRQQRVYRGQPQTVGEVQRDRDGYAVPQLPSGRSINANIIPSSITNNNGKVGAFSFGTQVEPQKQTPQPFTLEPAVTSSSTFTRSRNPTFVSGRALYNGSQQYDPQQFDSFYALYDDDVELYKDNDYGHQYTQRPSPVTVQQTYRGTPPPTVVPVAPVISTRPVPVRTTSHIDYTPRPAIQEDYDDALIAGQIDEQNQYRQPVRQPTREEGNELDYEHQNSGAIGFSTVRTPLRNTVFLTAPPTTTTTTTTTTARPPPPSSAQPLPKQPLRNNHRGRGSAHYSTLSNDQVNRGTPPSRARPTLKPSTSIVSKAQEFIDIYRSPPSRPPSVYPTPTPDKTAAKCRKDVCLLPDCSCGGRDVPGDLPVEQVPQIVLLTFDDSVNDLNKVLYADLFEKGRVNPNGCPISATFYVSHEWTDYSQVQNLYSAGHEMASHTISHSFGEQFSQKKWNREVSGQREILAAYGGVKLSDVRGMRAPFLSVGGNRMFKMLYDSNFTYDSSMPVYENRPPSWPYTLDYKLFHDCMIPPCPTRSYPGVWEVPMVMWQDLNGGRCSMGDACSNPPNSEGVYKMLLKNFDRHYTTNRAPFGLFYHAAWFTQPHHKEGFIMFLDAINRMQDVYIVTNSQALQWVRDPTPLSRINSFQPFHCDYKDRPKRCNNPKVCNLWHKSGVRYMRTCQPCPDIYPWTGRTGIQSSKIDNDIED